MERKTIVISGGSSGIGKALAGRYVSQGHDVIIGSPYQDELSLALGELNARMADGAQRINALLLDVGDERSVGAFVDHVARTHGKIDILVNCAGISVCKEFENTSSAEYLSTMLVNYYGTVLLTRKTIPLMRERGGGHIVNISSLAGVLGVYGYSAYSPSKFAIVGYSEVLRNELLCDGIGVSLVLPPDTDTPQLYRENLTKPAITKRITGGTSPLSADEVARAIVSGVRAGKFLIIPGLTARITYHANRLFPNLVYAYIKRIVRKGRHAMGKKIKIEGMSCGHCVARVKAALSALPGVTRADVDLASKTATVEGADVPDDELKAAVADAGYEVTSIA